MLKTSKAKQIPIQWKTSEMKVIVKTYQSKTAVDLERVFLEELEN
jgi:hypothetical protein